MHELLVCVMQQHEVDRVQHRTPLFSGDEMLLANLALLKLESTAVTQTCA